MIQNETKSPEILKAERQVEQAKARLAEAKWKESAKKRSDENKHKYMMGESFISIFQSVMDLMSMN